jgi:hypothetical protein
LEQGGAKAKIVIIGAIVLLMLLSVISGQNPFDVFIGIIKDTFVFLFFGLVFLAPIALLAYVFIICFTGFDGSSMNLSVSEITKQKMVSMLQSIMPSQPKNDNNKQQKKPPAKKSSKSGTKQ